MKPRASYRLQLTPDFGFAEAVAAVPYLADLGISHLYLSPVLQAAPGSTHGYDVVDPERVSEALGGEAGFDALVHAAQQAGLGLLVDIVPNHMSIAGTANRWWLDVLENGPASYYAPFFDVDWGTGLDDRVVLPILRERYGRALSWLKIRWERERFCVAVDELVLPLSPRSIGPLVRRVGDRLAHTELQYIGDALVDLPTSRERDPERRARRHRDKDVLLSRLAALAHERRIEQALAAEVAAINGDQVELDAILDRQNYRLCFYGVADAQLSHRRFFDIASLVGIRNEDPDVLLASHGRVFTWLRTGAIDGVRVDHVDGLREPGAYLQTLRTVAPEAWIVVEKILAPGEALPAWPIDGTTGYDFADTLCALLVDPAAEAALTKTFVEYTGEAFDPEAESRRARLEVMTDALHAELARLTELACRLCAVSPACRDYTRDEVQTALAEVLAGYSTYRTYLGERSDEIDRKRIADAVRAAARAKPDLDPDLLGFLEAALAFELTNPEALELARVAQQITGPIVAKGDEDTLSYRQVRLLARCEVGADLATWAISPDEAHRRLAGGAPHGMLATSTHDTKRSEDVRARIAALSEIPDAWTTAVERWRTRAAPGWGDIAPDRVFEYAAWQTLVGAWPLSLERAQRWAEKATREARQRTSWRHQDTAYEAARSAWLAGVFRELSDDLAGFVELVRPRGDRNALAQLLVKLVAPGVPDIYQGTELRDDSLVDPDNRRPVDFAGRRARLRELGDLPPRSNQVLDHAKLWTIRRVLALRRAEPALFEGNYEPLAAHGPDARHVFAFARSRRALICVVPRLGTPARATLAVEHRAWRNVLTGEDVRGGEIAVADLLRAFPTALLVASS